MNQLANLEQDFIDVDVDFFNEKEKEKLIQYPSAKEISSAVSKGVRIPVSEFLTYYLFHRKRLGTPGYQNYRAISQKLGIALANLDGCLDFNGTSICRPKNIKTQLPEISEHIGESIGLSVVSNIHKLIEADWEPIAEQRGFKAFRTFDFQIASDGAQIVQTETKGSSVLDNQIKSESIREHKKDIAEKKARISTAEKAGNYPFPASIRYGTITALDSRSDSRVKCWITDPEPKAKDSNPPKRRLLHRLRFLRNWISFVSPRSQLAAAIATRVGDLEEMGDPFELDGVPLRRGNGEPFEFFPYEPRMGHSTLLTYKSRVTDGPAGGVALQTSNKNLFFAGLQEQLAVIAARQEFEQILSFNNEPGMVSKTVECLFSEGRYRKLRLPPLLADRVEKSGGYFKIRLKGQLHYNRSGLVFGILPLVG